MASITFAAGTVIPSTWLNDVNSITYGTAVSVPWTTVTWSGSNVTHSGNHIFSSSISTPKIIVTSGVASVTNSLIQPSANAQVYSLLGHSVSAAGPGLQARWDSGTANRYLEFGNYNNVGAWAPIARLNDDRSFTMISDGGLGYGTGSGGTVTQATSKSTTVTLNKTNGQIVMNNAALAAGSTAQFLCNNSTVTEKDVVIITQNEAISALNYNIWAAVGAGYIRFHVKNIGVGSLSDALTINFAVIKAVTA